jgi:hypothetical protein
LNKNQIGQAMKGISVFILVAGILLLLFGGGALYTTFNLETIKSVTYRTGKGLNKQAGTFAEIVGIASAVFWLIRKVMVKIKKRDNLVKEWCRQLYIVFQKHHIFLGIITLVISFIHGLYFLLFRNVPANMGPRNHDTTLNFYSGIASFFALDVLAFLGWYHHSNRKTKQNVQTKKRHKIAALVFGIIALIHIYII